MTEDGGMEEVHLCSKAVWCPITVLQKDGHYFQRREHLNTVLWFPIVSCGTAYKPSQGKDRKERRKFVYKISS